MMTACGGRGGCECADHNAHHSIQDRGHVKRIVKLMSLVNSTGDFTEQHLVTNGACDLIDELFGSAGAHTSSLFGVAQIPLAACVVIEMITEVS